MKSNDHQVLENEYIVLKDGRKLAAKIWLPLTAASHPVPAILEYLPYRKRDGTSARDQSNYPVFAAAAYAGVRVDISGTGESDGNYDDEYSPRELSDGIEVINWIAAQNWCSGSVGMMGISWGGFNSLQIAALRPPALKAVIAIGTTVDRYNDDIHYKNGCHLYSNLYWSSTMLCFASRPPDPELVGARWKEMWIHRLNTQPFPLEVWLRHQRRDDYWKHGSICEDYSAIQIPAMVISGWGDGYINAPPAMAANNQAKVSAINGPWIHQYPHFAWPRPRMDFHKEAISWWDCWLKGNQNEAPNLPAYRAYISENVRPGGYRDVEAGHWVAEPNWPSSNIKESAFFLTQQKSLSSENKGEGQLTVCSPQDCGVACGEIFSLKPDSALSGDQRIDDAGSLTFETKVLERSITLLGRPQISLALSIDRPLGNIAVRICDVHPDGTSHRVSWGVLNLAHRKDNQNLSQMTPGEPENITIALDECGYRFLVGHRIHLSISTAYWPMIMPPPEVVTATISLGADSVLSLPIRQSEDSISVEEPENLSPLPEYVCHQKPVHNRTVEYDLQNGLSHYKVFDDSGEHEQPGHGLRSRHTYEGHWSISPNDPLSSVARNVYTGYLSRRGWRIRTESVSSMGCDKDNYYLEATITAYQNDSIVNVRNWEKTIKRDHS